MAALHGKAASVKLGTDTILDIGEWDLDVNRDTKEDTAFSDGAIPWRSYVAGLNGASGKFSGNLNMGDTTGQFAIWTSLTVDTPLAVKLYLDDTNYFASNMFISKMSMKSPIDDLETVEFSYQITGAVSFSAAG